MELLQKHERQYILSKGQRRKVIRGRRLFGNWIVHSKPSRRAVGVENKNLHKYNSDRLVEPDPCTTLWSNWTMDLLTNHELRYVRSNTYNATDPKPIGEKALWEVTYHSQADLVMIEEVLTFGRGNYLFEKSNAEGWTFSNPTSEDTDWGLQ